MTSIDLDRFLDVVSPENFQVGYTVQASGETVTNNPHRDNPGIFEIWIYLYKKYNKYFSFRF